jgi:hypothetical protein
VSFMWEKSHHSELVMLSPGAGREELNMTRLLRGWYEVVGGNACHRVHDGGFGEMKTLCGIRIRTAFAIRPTVGQTCLKCDRLDKKLSPGRTGLSAAALDDEEGDVD